jgi:hypothetical protein
MMTNATGKNGSYIHAGMPWVAGLPIEVTATHGIGQISLVPDPFTTPLAGERVGIPVGITKDGFHCAPGLFDWCLREDDAATTHLLIGALNVA